MQMRTTPHGILTCNQYQENPGCVHSVAKTHMLDQNLAATTRIATFFAASTLLFQTNTQEKTN